MRALYLGLVSVLMAAPSFAKDAVPNQRADIQIKTVQNVGFNSAGHSDEISFEVPPSTKSFLIQFSSDSDTAGISIELVSDPNGHIVIGQAVRKFNYAHPSLVGSYPEMEWENPTSDSAISGITTALIPNNLNTKVIPGQWKMKFSCKASNKDCNNLKGTAQVVMKKSTLANASNPTIPLRLHFPGKAKWTAKSAPRNKDFKLFMKTLEDIFKFAGLNIEVLSMEDEDDVVFSGIGDGLQHILKHSKGDAVNVYFAKTTFSWMSPSVIAVSYELPGGYMSPYTTGVVVRTKTIFSEEEKKSPNQLDYVSIDSHMSIPKYALTTAHEISHYLGLFHVCESGAFGEDSGVHDPLNSACNEKNMMYPSLGSANFYLTPQQVESIKRHPLVY